MPTRLSCPNPGRRHLGGGSSVVFSVDGKQLFVGGATPGKDALSDGEVRVLDAVNGGEISRSVGYGATVTSVVLDRTGRRLISASSTGQVRIDILDGQ